MNILCKVRNWYRKERVLDAFAIVIRLETERLEMAETCHLPVGRDNLDYYWARLDEQKADLDRINTLQEHYKAMYE